MLSAARATLATHCKSHVYFLELIDGLLKKRTLGFGKKCHETENKYELLWYLATFFQLC